VKEKERTNESEKNNFRIPSGNHVRNAGIPTSFIVSKRKYSKLILTWGTSITILLSIVMDSFILTLPYYS
jgi:hypothetical protein